MYIHIYIYIQIIINILMYQAWLEIGHITLQTIVLHIDCELIDTENPQT